MYKKAINLIFLVLWFCGFSQSEKNSFESKYTIGLDDPKLVSFEKKYAKITNEVNAKYSSQVKKIYKSRHDDFLKSIKDSDYVFNDYLQKYLENILHEIKEKNKTINDIEIRLFVNREYEANAYSLGEGTIGINLGLITCLENESQLAYILCHEIAHILLDHSEIDLHSYLDLINDKNLKKDIKTALRNEYGANAEVLKILTSHGLKENKKSRIQEFQADSLGLLLFQNTSYHVLESIRSMEILDSVDINIASSEIRKNLNSIKFPFKNQWLQDEDLISLKQDYEDRMLEDSMKTHPDCKKRIKKIFYLINKNKAIDQDLSLNAQINYLRFKNIAEREIVKGCIQKKNYSMGLYFALCLLNKYGKDSDFTIGAIGDILNKCYYAQVKHELGKSLLRPSNDYHPNINEINYFFNNITLSEIGKINYYFLKNNLVSTSEESYYQYYVACDINQKYPEKEDAKMEYLRLFPNGKYVKQFNLEQKDD